jgi:hypothetical protein
MMVNVSSQRVFTWKLTQLVWLLFGLLEALIGIRVVLRLIAANPRNYFALFVYRLSDLFVWPFVGLTRTPVANGAVLEVSSIIAMFVYALVAWALVQLIWIVFDRPGATAVASTPVVRTSVVSTPVARETTVVDQTVPSRQTTVVDQTIPTRPQN